MNTNTVIGIIVVIAIIIIGGIFFVTSDDSEEVMQPGEETATEETDDETTSDNLTEDNTIAVTEDVNESEEQPQEAKNVITYSKTGFTPSPLTIKVGDTVTWKNESGALMWIASAFHPTHTVYPDSDIRKCDTAQKAGIFDACEGIPSGSSWSFTFNKAGDWGYHDHLNPSRFGQVKVQ